MAKIRHYGWHLSFFAGKTRSYLTYKQADFEDVDINLWHLRRTIPNAVGAAVMPVVQLADGNWLQDTSLIIDHFEGAMPQRPVMPQDDVMRVASRLFEAWTDEFWIPSAVHTRWSYPENYALFERDGGAALLPYAPRFLQNLVIKMPARFLRKALYGLGVRPENNDAINEWTLAVMGLLNDHFSKHRWLLGDRPTLMDFALMGPMYGHLGRDPWPKREMLGPNPALKAWLERTTNSPDDVSGSEPLSLEALSDLAPIFKRIFSEFLPMMQGIADLTKKAAQETDGPIPRTLQDVSFPMGNHIVYRRAMPFGLWKMQRIMDDYRALSAPAREAVDTWVADMGGMPLKTWDFPRVDKSKLQITVVTE